MSVTYSLFVRWMAAKGHTSQREAAKALGVSPMGPSNWKNGHNAAAHIIERMAKDLGEDPTAHIIAVFQETAKGPDVRTLQRMAKRLGYGAVMAAGLLSSVAAPPVRAQVVDDPGIYIMRSPKRGRKCRKLRTRACESETNLKRESNPGHGAEGGPLASCTTFRREYCNEASALPCTRSTVERLRPWRVRVRNQQHHRPYRAVAWLEAARFRAGVAG